MVFLTAIIALIGAIIGAVAIKLIVSEIEAWIPNFAHFLITRAAKRLPEHEQQRRLEEWLADNDDYPGKLSKLLHASGCLRASFVMRRPLTTSIFASPENHALIYQPEHSQYLSLEQLFYKFIVEVEPSDDVQSIKLRMRAFVHPDIPFDDPNWDEFAAAVKSCNDMLRKTKWNNPNK